MRRILLSLLAVLVLFYLIACTKRDEPSPAKAARASATKAYEKYFGPAPTTDKGTCYAFVIYFPSSKDPGKVVPFPFFSFDNSSLKKVAVQRLIGGMADVKSYQSEILQPFPQGTHVIDISSKDGVETVNFSSELARADRANVRVLVDAVVLTLRQFSGVGAVDIRIDGKESKLAALAGSTGEGAVLQPSPPRLLGVTAIKDKGATKVEEVDAFFDRPVDIKLLQMTGADGKPFPGDVYHSVFDMAAVLKPIDPSVFKPGMPIKVRWKITDKMGRSAEGEGEVPLELKEH